MVDTPQPRAMAHPSAPNMSPPITNLSPVPKPNQTNQSPFWTVFTHNIQGFNDLAKKKLWLQFCTDKKVDICLITETQIQSQPNYS
jgi:hypothetical protein